jgi:hypothetical protein
MEQLTSTPERQTMLLVGLGLLAGAVAAAALGPTGALSAALPVVLVAYSSLLADRGARRGPGPALVRVNAELVAANARLSWQIVHGVDAALRDAATARLNDLRTPTALAGAFLTHHFGPTEAMLDQIAPGPADLAPVRFA